MAKTIEAMGTLWSQKSDIADSFGYDSNGNGTLAPSGFGGNEIILLEGSTSSNLITLVLKKANPTLTSINFSANLVDQANVGVDLTSADGVTFTETSIDVVMLMELAALSNVGLNVYFQTTDTAADVAPFYTSEHGASKVPPVHEEGSLVRVGSPPADPVCYPNHLDGWDSADLSGDKYP